VVKPGPVDGNAMAVEGPLQPGDKVVIDGADRLRDGAKVEVIASDPTKRPGADAPAGGSRRGARGGADAAPGATKGAGERTVAPGASSSPATAAPPGTPSSPATAAPPGASSSPATAASSGALSQPAAEGNGGQRQRRMDNLPPEVAEKLKAMSPEERRAWFQKQREEGGPAGKATPN